MRANSLGIVLAAMTILVGPSMAFACPVEGTVMCERTNADPAVFLEGVGVKLTDPAGLVYSPAALTDASGWFTFVADGYATAGMWTVTLDLTALGGAAAVPAGQVNIQYGEPWVISPSITVTAENLPLCGGGGSSCDLSPVPEGILPCDDRPWGNPRAECAKFGNYVPVGDGWNVNGSSIIATAAGDFAVVKAGRACYAITKNVSIGDVLAAPSGFGVSHVTYCSCPPQ